MPVSAVSLRSDIKEREGSNVLSPGSHIVHKTFVKIKNGEKSVHCDPLWYDKRVRRFRGVSYVVVWRSLRLIPRVEIAWSAPPSGEQRRGLGWVTKKFRYGERNDVDGDICRAGVGRN